MSVYKDMAHDAGYRGEEAKQMAEAIEQDHMRQAMEHQEQEQEPDQIDMMDRAELEAAFRSSIVEIEQCQDIRADMESLLAWIADQFDVSEEPHQTWQERFMERIEEAPKDWFFTGFLRGINDVHDANPQLGAERAWRDYQTETTKDTEPHAWVNQGICCRRHATTEQKMSTRTRNENS